MHLADKPWHTQDWPKSEAETIPGLQELREGLTMMLPLSLALSVCLSLTLCRSSLSFPLWALPPLAPLSTLDHLHQVDIRRVYSGVCNCILSLVLHYQPWKWNLIIPDQFLMYKMIWLRFKGKHNWNQVNDTCSFFSSSVLRFDFFFFRYSIEEEVDYFASYISALVCCVGRNLYTPQSTNMYIHVCLLILISSHFTCGHLFRQKQTNIIILFAILLMAIKFAMILKMYSKHPKGWNSPAAWAQD